MAFHIVILSGGVGTRLWPVSRSLLPKQFARLIGEKSLFERTVKRAMDLCPASIVVVTARDQAHLCQQHAPSGLPFVVKAEPVGRNTLPAIIYGAAHLADEDTILVMPSDHLIEHDDVLAAATRAAVSLAEEGRIVTYGIQPDYPATGYGYIEKGGPLGQGFHVNRFVEKPDQARAQVMVDSGDYYWNSGMFVMSVGTLRTELGRFHPELLHLFECKETVDEATFAAVAPLSFDYGIAELTEQMALVSGAFGWNDMGSWKSVWDETRDGANGLASSDDVSLLAKDCERVLVYSDRGQDKLYAAVGVKDLAVVDTGDALMITHLDHCQEVKSLRDQAAKMRPETVQRPMVEYRPWGSFEILQEHPGYKVKRLLVTPGHRLSLQSHNRRSEHWVVVKGTATVVNGDDEFEMTAGNSTHIPVQTWHRLANLGNEDLEVIEVQTGDYLGEDDIVRYQDDFNRIPSVG